MTLSFFALIVRLFALTDIYNRLFSLWKRISLFICILNIFYIENNYTLQNEVSSPEGENKPFDKIYNFTEGSTIPTVQKYKKSKNLF